MKKLAVVILSALTLLSGCGGKVSGGEQEQLEKKLIERVDQDKNISKEGKDIIKKSGVLNYEVNTYGKKMDVKKIIIEDVGVEGQQPYIKMTIKEKNKKENYLISCGMKEKKCGKINDSYLLNVISNGARKQIDPYFRKAFGSHIPEYYVLPEPGKKVKAQMLKSGEWEYSKYKGKVPLTISIRINGKPNQAAYAQIMKFMKFFQNNQEVKLGLVNFSYMTKPPTEYKFSDELIVLSLNQGNIDKMRSVKDLKEREMNEGINTYQTVYDLMVQQHSKNRGGL